MNSFYLEAGITKETIEILRIKSTRAVKEWLIVLKYSDS
jgi:hypothetical protein